MLVYGSETCCYKSGGPWLGWPGTGPRGWWYRRRSDWQWSLYSVYESAAMNSWTSVCRALNVCRWEQDTARPEGLRSSLRACMQRNGVRIANRLGEERVTLNEHVDCEWWIQRCSEENVDEVRWQVGTWRLWVWKDGNGTGPFVRLEKYYVWGPFHRASVGCLKYCVCFGVTDVKRIWWWWWWSITIPFRIQHCSMYFCFNFRFRYASIHGGFQ